jgi:hypothetical protein
MTTYSSNKQAGQHVTNKEPFKGSNTWGEWIKDLYVVYSYGRHFPMYVWDEKLGMWFGNEDKYSRSTTRQQGQLRPSAPFISYYNTDSLIKLVSTGSVAEWTIHKAQN